MTQHLALSFAPLLALPWLIALGALALVVALVALLARQPGAWWRLGAAALLLGALGGPSLVEEQREGLPDVVALVIDRSASQSLADRAAQTDAARADLERQLRARPRTEVRVAEVLDAAGDADGTRLFDALKAAIADVPPERLAGVVAVTDGRVHDAPPSLRSIGVTAPFHALITGREGERDRRIEVLEAPRFGIVGREQVVALRVVDEGAGAAEPARLTLRRDGEAVLERVVTPGALVRLPVTVAHAGPNVVEVEVAPLAGELTPINNRLVVTIEGVRDKLRVLLVSGEPHAGERTWRNLLKSDPGVDLVHFTILRPPEKQDGTPINELSLIAFPTRELFVQKINEFDLIVFDRYANQSVLPAVYFENIARYVREGGAVLLAAGPEFGTSNGLASTPLGPVLPARPLGGSYQSAYQPRVTDVGQRHPVTRALPGSLSEPPGWAPWFRLVNAEARAGSSVMAGPDGRPLLVLAREGKGRVALLLSDHAWLWARGLGEGGPHLDLLRRSAHWLMKQPDLEEEAVRLTARGRTLTVERQTLAETAPDVRLTGPDGSVQVLSLARAEPGLFRASVTARLSGLHRVADEGRVAFASVGAANPREFAEVTSTEALLAPLAAETGGAARRLDRGAGLVVPRVVDVRAGSRFASGDTIGLRPTTAHVVRGVGLLPLGVGALGLGLLLVPMVLAWWREGRGSRRAV